MNTQLLLDPGRQMPTWELKQHRAPCRFGERTKNNLLQNPVTVRQGSTCMPYSCAWQRIASKHAPIGKRKYTPMRYIREQNGAYRRLEGRSLISVDDAASSAQPIGQSTAHSSPVLCRCRHRVLCPIALPRWVLLGSFMVGFICICLSRQVACLSCGPPSDSDVASSQPAAPPWADLRSVGRRPTTTAMPLYQ